MTKTMEALLSKSAKLRENHMNLKEDQADERQGVVKKTRQFNKCWDVGVKL